MSAEIRLSLTALRVALRFQMVARCACQHSWVDTKPSGLEMFLVRVGDAERDACIGSLTDHHLHGRLSVEELDRRQRAALNAVTAADLAALIADLPGSAQQDGPIKASGLRGRISRRSARRVAILAAPPVAVVTTSAMMATNAYVDRGATLFACLVSGAVGVASHWVASRFRRD